MQHIQSLLNFKKGFVCFKRAFNNDCGLNFSLNLMLHRLYIRGQRKNDDKRRQICISAARDVVLLVLITFKTISFSDFVRFSSDKVSADCCAAHKIEKIE